MRTLGSRYVLHELLGQGTTGEVWRASRRDDGVDVAVKMLRPEFADDPVVVDRFLREWQILYDINSPELVRVLDLVNERDALAIVMELVDGTDLREYLRHSAPLPVQQAVQIIVHVLWALDTVHGFGVVHRDVKPENVLLDERNGDGPAVRLTDFGIARMVDTLSRGRAPLTGPIGTPLYMAPELGTGEAPTPAVDIYSAGIVLYEMLAGAPPFDEANPTEMLRAHVEVEPLPIKGVPGPVWKVLAAMLEKSPAGRPPGAAATARALEDALARSADLLPRQRGSEDTWERPGAAKSVADEADTNDTFVGAGPRQLAGVAAGVAGAGAGALNMTKAQAGPDGYGPGDWDDDPATQIGPVVGGPSGPPGGRWDDDAATQLGPAVGGGPRGARGRWDDAGATRVGGPRGGGWDDEDAYEDPPTDEQHVRVPSRAGAIQSSRNTVISAIPAGKQPTPASGGRPPAKDNRQRLRIAAGAGLVVALIAAAGGWALASSGGNSPASSDTTTSTSAPTRFQDPSGNWVDSTATAPYTTMINGTPVIVAPGSRKPSAGPSQAATSTTTAAGAPTTPPTSASPTTGTIPDVVGKSQSAATSAITNAGFASPTVSQACDDNTPIGDVSKQSPAGGTKADLSTPVSITMSANCVAVPSVTGGTTNSAISKISNAGLSAQTDAFVPWFGSCQQNGQEDGPVTAQNPSAGTQVVKGSNVYITYACKATPPTTTASTG